MRKIGILLTSRNNYSLLREWNESVSTEDLTVLNIDDIIKEKIAHSIKKNALLSNGMINIKIGPSPRGDKLVGTLPVSFSTFFLVQKDIEVKDIEVQEKWKRESISKLCEMVMYEVRELTSQILHGNIVLDKEAEDEEDRMLTLDIPSTYSKDTHPYATIYINLHSEHEALGITISEDNYPNTSLEGYKQINIKIKAQLQITIKE